MHHYPLLEILAAGFTLALILGYLAKRLKLSPIVGYLLAGFLAGPLTPGFVADAGLAAELSEAGVILLMFGVGLHFHLDDLLRLKGISLPGALFQSAVSCCCGYVLAAMAGLNTAAGLLLGMGLAVASTVVLLRVLTDNDMLDTVHGHVAVGWLVVEDILTVLVLVLLPGLGGMLAPDGAGVALAPVLKAVGLAFARLALLWIIVLVVGGRVVPWLLNHVVRTRSQELFTLTVLVAAFATAVSAAVFFEASMALGAFLGGMVVGKSKLSHQAGADLLPFRDAFAVLFFLSVGMLLDPAFILARPGLVLGAVLIVLLIKPLAAMFIVSLLGYSARTGLVVGVSLAQVGEFSFILAQQAQALKIIPQDVYNVLVVCAIVSITLNPGLFRAVPAFERALARSPGLWRLLNIRADKRAARGAEGKISLPRTPLSAGRQAVVVGYGPTGRRVREALREKGLAVTVIDMNVDTVNALNEEDRRAVFGDSSRPDILKAAGLESAEYLIITVPALESALTTAAAARSLNADLRILARARFFRDGPILKSAGATAVAFEEEALAGDLARMVLDDVRGRAARVPPAEG